MGARRAAEGALQHEPRRQSSAGPPARLTQVFALDFHSSRVCLKLAMRPLLVPKLVRIGLGARFETGA
jgi:hypothetical protein